jgi:hypothetical protein
MKKAKIKVLTVPKKRKTQCCARPETVAQCCAKASRLVAGCHD